MIKIAIFDQDGTFYSLKHKLARVIRNKTKEWVQKSLEIEKNELEKIYSKLPKEYPNPLDGFSSIGLKTKDYMNKVFDKINPSDYIKENKELKRFLRNLGISIYVVTVASKEYSQKLQNVLGIKESIEKTYSLGEVYPNKKTKFEIYEEIRKRAKLNRKQILIVGDNYPLDLEFARKNGYLVVLVNNKNKRKKEKRLRANNLYSINKFINSR